MKRYVLIYFLGMVMMWVAVLIAVGVVGNADQSPLTVWHFDMWLRCGIGGYFGFRLSEWAKRKGGVYEVE